MAGSPCKEQRKSFISLLFDINVSMYNNLWYTQCRK